MNALLRAFRLLLEVMMLICFYLMVYFRSKDYSECPTASFQTAVRSDDVDMFLSHGVRSVWSPNLHGSTAAEMCH